MSVGQTGRPPLLDEWRDPDRGVRIAVEWLAPLVDVSEQYVSPPRSLRLLLTYVGRFGVADALLKVRSRLSERGRNRKTAALVQGTVLEGPEGMRLKPGSRVWAFAPSAAPDAGRIVVDRAFVIEAGTAALRPETPPALPPPLQACVAWSPFSGRTVDAPAVGRALAELSASLVGADVSAPDPSSAAPVAERWNPPGARPSSRPTVAVFGMGNYAKQLIAPNIPKAMELMRVHELDPRQLAGWGRRDVGLDTAPWPRDEDRYDLWFVAGYHCTHAPIALEALRRGGAVAVEKPLATTREELAKLRTALESDPSARLFTCFQRRYAEYNAWIREDLQANPGDPLNYDCIVYEIPLSPLHWYSWPSSRSRLISNGCHWIDHFMLLNDYSEVTESHVVAGAHNGSLAYLRLANGAEFTMRLTEIGSPRIGVRDHVEVSLGGRTATIRNAQLYSAEDGVKTLRRRRVSVMAAYQTMYREICRRVLDGGPGEPVETLRASHAAIELDEAFQAQLGR
jgi:predicted dehydrogenase